MATLLDIGGERADNTAPMKRTPERSTPPVPILVSWIGNTELKVMVKCGGVDERKIARQVLKADQANEEKDAEVNFQETSLEGAWSSLHLILGNAEDEHPEFRVPENIPRFGKLLLLFSRNVPEAVFKDKFLPRYRSFLWRAFNRKPDDLEIDVRYLPIDPWDYEKVYNATRDALKSSIRQGESLDHIYFNLTPGTVTQEITLALIGKEMDDVQFIQVNKNHRDVTVCDIPFDISVVRRMDSEAIARALAPDAEILFPDTPKGRAEQKRLADIARVDVDCLLTGDTGVGKNRIAETVLQTKSSRAGKPFIPLNCATLGGDLNMMKSQLFGEKKGAHSTSTEDKPGLARKADGGILFLDEVENLRLDAQAVLLDFLQPREGAPATVRTFTPLGAKKEETTDIRIVAATNKDLWDMVQRHEFREDLYWRLALLTFHVPSLAERKSQGVLVHGKSVVSFLAQQFIEKFKQELNSGAEFEPEALAFLEKQEWPGNVRQLRNVVLRALVFAPANGRIDLAAIQREVEIGECFPVRDKDENENGKRSEIGCNGIRRSDGDLVDTPPQDIPDDMLRETMEEAIAAIKKQFATEAVRRAGTQSAAEQLLGIRRQTISKWKSSKQSEASNE